MEPLKEEWESVISEKRKFKGCFFIRVRNRPDCYIMKVYGKKQAEEIAFTICQEHNEKISK